MDLSLGTGREEDQPATGEVDVQEVHRRCKLDVLAIGGVHGRAVSVSNSLSGGDWQLDEVPAVGDPAHVAQIGKCLRVSTGERQWRVARQ